MPIDLPTSLLFIDGTNLDHRLSEGIDTRDVDYTKLFAALSRGTQSSIPISAPPITSSRKTHTGVG